jgi:small-conductance mechanosensitive channel
LSNLFCSFLIVATRPFRINDTIEVLESVDKPGLCGQVVDINLIYTTLSDRGEGARLPAARAELVVLPAHHPALG